MNIIDNKKESLALKENFTIRNISNNRSVTVNKKVINFTDIPINNEINLKEKSKRYLPPLINKSKSMY